MKGSRDTVLAIAGAERKFGWRMPEQLLTQSLYIYKIATKENCQNLPIL